MVVVFLEMRVFYCGRTTEARLAIIALGTKPSRGIIRSAELLSPHGRPSFVRKTHSLIENTDCFVLAFDNVAIYRRICLSHISERAEFTQHKDAIIGRTQVV